MKKSLIYCSAVITLSGLSLTATAQQGMRVGSTAAPSEVLHVDGAILIGNTTNNNVGTIRWNGTDFQGYNGTTWVSLNSAGALYTAGAGLTLSGTTFSHNTQTAIDLNATDNGINVIDRVVVNTLGHVTSVVARDLSAATTSAAGVMSAADKTKLDGITDGATANLGTVTSVALSLPAILTVAGSPITGSGTLSATLALQTPNVVFAGPTTAPNAAPTFRALVLSDLPSGIVTANNGLTMSTTTNVQLGGSLLAPTTIAQAAHTLAFTSTATNGFSVDGTTFSVDAANDRIGMGTAAPDFRLHVKGVGINQGPDSQENVIARFEQSAVSSGLGIQLVGNRAQAKASSFIEFKNFNGSEYTLGRVAGLNENNSMGGLIFLTNGGGVTEKMRITSAGVVQLNAYTTNGIVRATGGNGTLSTTAGGVNLASEVTGVLPVANGGTGSTTQNFVDLTTAQTAAGVKTWSNNAIFNGSVGIKNASPAKLLEIGNNLNTAPNVGSFQISGSNGAPGAWKQWSFEVGATSTATSTHNTERLRILANGADMVTIDGVGNVGIGTNNPIAPLHVQSQGSATYASFTFYAKDQYTNTPNNPTSCCAGTVNGVSIHSSGRVMASEFDAFSDARIKNVVGITNSSDDLSSLLAIEITDYTMKDKAKDLKPYKKVIAQQVESIYPQAVSSITDVVPDIYAVSSIKDGYVSLQTDLKEGDKVKLIFDEGAEMAMVTSTDENGFTVDLEKSGNVFVYGREVNDFRTVDYEAISMLNVSATQELYRLIEKLQKENANVNEKLKNYASLVSDIELLKEAVGIDKRAEK